MENFIFCAVYYFEVTAINKFNSFRNIESEYYF